MSISCLKRINCPSKTKNVFKSYINSCCINSWKHVQQCEIDVPLSRFSLKFSSGMIARFADGNCVVKQGGTSVLVTAVSKMKPSYPPIGFMPLVVDYRQKSAAAGRIPTNYLRRELGPTEKEILTSRIIDRSVRPLFPKSYSCETQLSCNLLAVDGIHDPDVVSINAASAALSVSDIPWSGPIGAVRVGLVDNKIIVNPTRKEVLKSSMNLVVAATEHKRVVMLEGSSENLAQEDILKAIETGVLEAQLVIKGIRELMKNVGKEKRDINDSVTSQEIHECALLLLEAKVTAIYADYSHNKVSRDKALESVKLEALEMLKENFKDTDPNILAEELNSVVKTIFRHRILETKMRCDGRGLTDLRDINCSVDKFSPLHGSALFQRGQTQVFCTVAFDSLDSTLKSDPVSVISGGIKEKNFMLHYEFPPYATNETGRLGAFGRREVGHAALAEKSLRPVIPTSYPFTIRLTGEVLESNGSSSMATVCSGSLALMDAGVPITLPVAGVAIGLISLLNEEKPDGLADYKILTDILGIEDYFGDMDFKIAGSKNGITSIQLDVKIPGVPQYIIVESIKQATDAICKILEIMQTAIDKTRTERKNNWPVSETLEVPAHKKSKFFGFGGYNLKKLSAETGVQLTAIGDSTFSVFAPNQDAMDEAKEMFDTLLAEDNIPNLEFGCIYMAQIVEIKESGVMVTLYPSMKPSLLHNTQLDQRKIYHPNALGLEVGQEIPVKYFGRDPASGNMRLSRKVLQSTPSTLIKNYSHHSTVESGTSNSTPNHDTKLFPD